MSDGLLASIAAVAFVLGMFYSGSETAFIACNRIRMRHLSDGGDRRARRVLQLLDDPGHLLSSVLVGTNLAVTACASTVTAIATRHWGEHGVEIATAALVPLFLIFNEIIPKGLFLTYANRAALLSVGPLRALTTVVYPMVWVLSRAADALTRLVSGSAHDRRPAIRTEEVLYHIADSREAGLIAPETTELVDRALSLREVRARDVAVPLERMVMLDADAPVESYAEVMRRERFSRFPLYRGETSRVVAVMSLHEYMTAPDPEVLRASLRPPNRVAADTPVVDILVPMLEEGRHMVIVEDDAEIVGMATLEDVLERLVGAITDEYH